MQTQKAKTQIEKRMDSLDSSGGSYTAGEGIYIETGDRRIMLRKALGDTLGGVAVSETSDEGVKMNNTHIALKNPTSKQTGGIKLGDGLVPYLGLNSNTGLYSPGENCIVHLRLADGLKFVENNEEAEAGTIEYGENTYGGRAVSLNIGDGLEIDEETGAVKATGYGASFGITILNGFISVKIGEDFEFAEDGSLVLKAGKVGDYTAGGGIAISSDNEISVNVGEGLEIDGSGAVVLKNESGGSYSAGNGIEISDENEIAAKIGEGLEFGSDGAINALPNIESAVIISEANARYLLHEYTEIKYTAGNRIGYAGPFNQIVVQNYILSKYDQTYIKSDYASEAELPDVAYYVSYNFADKSLHTNYQGINAVSELGTEPTVFTSAYTTYQIYVIRATGDRIAIASNNAYEGKFGITLLWENIYPPGYVYNNDTYEYGAVGCQLCYKIKTSTSYAFQRHAYGSFLLPFASEAEYNAAVGLTYEPVELTEVQETVTEV